MDQPDTPAYLRLLARARAATQAETWRNAIPLWRAVIAENPVEGRFWQQLAQAQYQGDEYRDAIGAYEQAIALGAGYPAEAIYRIACCHALLGEREEALTALDRAFARGYRHVAHAQTDPDLHSLHNDARFREIVALVDTTGMSREEGWRTDLAFLAREVKRVGYSPFRFVSETEFDAAVATLHDTLPTLTDARIVVEIMKIMRLVGDGHTRLEFANDLPDLEQTLPVQFYLFEEGLYITAADPRYADLLGAEVLRFADQSVDAVFAALDPLISRDNAHWLKQIIPYRLREAPLLHALGLVPEPRRVALTIRDREGQTRTVTLATDTSQPDIWYAIPYPAGWLFFPETLATPLPHYLRNAGASYWFDYLANSQTVYFKFNRVRDDAEESLAAFCARLFRFINEHAVERLVLDMRGNNGGNTFLEMPLLHGLIACEKVNQPGKLFVIIGRRTFSAAQNGSALIERHTHAVFVGEPTGSSPNFVGETVLIQLPYSKLRGSISDLSWQSSWPTDYRTWIAPRLYTPPTFAAYAANRDPALEAILACDEHLPGW